MTPFIKIILLTLVLLAIAFVGLAIKLFFKKDATLPGGGCSSGKEGYSCSCSNEEDCDYRK